MLRRMVDRTVVVVYLLDCDIHHSGGFAGDEKLVAEFEVRCFDGYFSNIQTAEVLRDFAYENLLLGSM